MQGNYQGQECKETTGSERDPKKLPGPGVQGSKRVEQALCRNLPYGVTRDRGAGEQKGRTSNVPELAARGYQEQGCIKALWYNGQCAIDCLGQGHKEARTLPGTGVQRNCQGQGCKEITMEISRDGCARKLPGTGVQGN